MKESFKDYLSHNKQMSFNEILFSFIDEKGFAKNIFVDDYFSYQLIRETVGLGADVQYQESSYILEDIVDKIHTLPP